MKYEIVKESTFEKARKSIQDLKKLGKAVAFRSGDDDLNRKILEKAPIDLIIIPQKGRKDRQKQRDSGFNQVLAKTANKNKVKLGIDLNEIINSRGKDKAKILARIKQNIDLCKKNKVDIKFLGKKDKYDIKSLALVLGMPTSATKNLF